MAERKEGDRIKDLRKRNYGEGAIVGHVKDGEEYWIIRWDNPGLDNEWLERGEFKLVAELECTCNDYPHHELCGAVQDYPDSEGKNGSS